MKYRKFIFLSISISILVNIILFNDIRNTASTVVKKSYELIAVDEKDAQKSKLYYVKHYGLIADGSKDNTKKFSRMLKEIPEGSTIVFEPKGKYKGNFEIFKSINIKGNNAIFINHIDNKPVLFFRPRGVKKHKVQGKSIVTGSTSFNIVHANKKFKVGDIGTIWDGSRRSDGVKVNYETIKIKSIEGNKITVEGFIASNMKSKKIVFYHAKSKVKDFYVKNINITPSSSHAKESLYLYHTSNVSVDNIHVVGNAKSAVSFKNSFQIKATNIKVSNPTSTSPGYGYGLQLYGVSHFFINNIHGDSTRHIYDQDSAYFGQINNIFEDNAIGAPCVLAHNGFTSYISLNNVNVNTTHYAVYLSNQGYNDAKPEHHTFNQIKINNVYSYVKSIKGHAHGVDFRNTGNNIVIDNVNVYRRSKPQGKGAYALRFSELNNAMISNIFIDYSDAFIYFSEYGHTKFNVKEFKTVKSNCVFKGRYPLINLKQKINVKNVNKRVC